MFRRDHCTSRCMRLPHTCALTHVQRAFSNILDIQDIKDEEVYPAEYQAMFEQLWSDSDVQKAVILGRQVGLPDKYVL